MFHVIIWDYYTLANGSSIALNFWQSTDVVLGRFRMPVLFALSGLLCSRGLLLGWKDSKNFVRVATNSYLYSIWLTLYFLFFTYIFKDSFPHSVFGVADWIEQFWIPDTTLWFVLALAVYPVFFIFSNMFLPRHFGVYGVSILLWGISGLVDPPVFIGKIMEHFIFYAFGVCAASTLWGFSKAKWYEFFALVLLMTTTLYLGTLFDSPVRAVFTALSNALAIPIIIVVMGLVCKVRVLANLGSFIGSHTLPIYLLHPIFLALWSSVSVEIFRLIQGIALFNWLYPFLLTIAVVGACLVSNFVLARLPGNFLFKLPPVLHDLVKKKI